MKGWKNKSFPQFDRCSQYLINRFIILHFLDCLRLGTNKHIYRVSSPPPHTRYITSNHLTQSDLTVRMTTV